MAREYLARRIDNPLHAAAELARYRDAAQRLVRSPWAQGRIHLLADALLQHRTLTAGEEIAGLTGMRCAEMEAPGRWFDDPVFLRPTAVAR